MRKREGNYKTKSIYAKDMESEDKEYQSENDEYMDLIFQKFKEFLMHEKGILKFQKQSKDRSIVLPNFFQCRKKDHMKKQFPWNQR